MSFRPDRLRGLPYLCLCAALLLLTLPHSLFAQAPSFQWANWAGTAGNQHGVGVTLDGSGNVYITGYISNNNNDFNSTLISSTGSDDIFLAKYDANGNLIWVRAAGGGGGSDQGLGVTVDPSGNPYVCGVYRGTSTFYGSPNILLSSAGGDDIFYAKFDPLNGDVVWASSAGGPGDDAANEISSNGTGVFITGTFRITATFGALPLVSSSGGSDVFLCSADAATGIPQWVVTGGSSQDESGNGVCYDAGGIYVSGYYGNAAITFQNQTGSMSNNGQTDVFLVKYDFAGNGIWQNRAGGIGVDVGNISATNGTFVCLAGRFEDMMNLYDPGSPPVSSISSFGSTTDGFVATYDCVTGNFIWIRSENGTAYDETRSLSIAPSGDIITCGYFDGTLPFDLYPDATSNGFDPFVTAYTSNGTFIWGKQVSGNDNDRANSIVTSGSETFITGWFRSTPASFDANLVSSSGGDDIFLAKLGCYVTVANAGPDQTLCASSTVLAGNLPISGSGLWSLVSGVATITTPTSSTTTVTGLVPGNATLRWTITNGTCVSFDDIIITVDANPTPSNAGPDQTLCATMTVFAANTPSIGTGTWTLISGTGIISNPNSPTSSVTALGIGANTFRWTITNGACPSSIDDVIITRDDNPTPANAGPDQTICSTMTTLAGNTPVTGTGTWTLIAGSGIITAPNSPNSGITSLGVGANTFRWTISNGVCPSSFDDVVITRDSVPTTANAGPDQTLCATTATLAGNTPTIGSGVWTLITGSGIITSPTSPTSGITSLGVGPNTFRWTITNGTCPSSIDDVIITRDDNPTPANAGPDQTICSTTATLAGNTPVTGTGTWTLIAGSGIITVPNSPNSGITSLGVGANTFRWTITNGVCPSSFDDVVITRDSVPTTANAGPDQTLCATTATLAGNTPTIGSGVWTLITGSGIITLPTSPISGITSLGVGPNTFRWTITNGTCPSSFDDVIITRDDNPTPANAGPDQTICSTTATLAGNTPVTGTGTWTLIAGSGIITAPNSPNSGITSLGVGSNTFRWTISNGVCPSSFDDVVITRDSVPTTANAGPDQTLCATTATLAGNTPIVGSGVWTLITGSGIITSPTSPTSGITSLGVGPNTFRWTITNGTCPSSFDDVIITRDDNPTPANAGPDQTLCSTSATLSGNVPIVGTGMWTLISGSGIISNPASPSSGVTALGVGANTFRWTISNGTCPSSSDDVIITRDSVPTTANAGPDQSICSNNTMLNANFPAVGTGQWQLVSGSGNIMNASMPSSAFNGIGAGTNILVWTISNGTCPPSTDTVIITSFQNPSTAVTSADQVLCNDTTTISANIPVIGTGAWSLVSGSAIILSPSSATSLITSMPPGIHTFRWTITNGVCPPSTDDIQVQVDAFPDISDAGPDQVVYIPFAVLAANQPVVGTGVWSIVQGTGLISNINDPTTQVTSLSAGDNIFRWTIFNGTCPSNFDDVTISLEPLQIPNAFSPNGDQVNDLFEVTGLLSYQDVALQVFNKWGVPVYESSDYRNDWNGTGPSGDPLSDDTYFYIMKFPGDVVYNGYILIRR